MNTSSLKTIVIVVVVFINAMVGFLQEAKAEKAIESLARVVATCLSLTQIV